MDVFSTDGLKSKIEGLIEKYETLRTENAFLSAKVSSLERDAQDKSLTIKSLQERINKLQLTSAFENSSTDKSEAKRKVSKLIREIDGCIALLEE